MVKHYLKQKLLVLSLLLISMGAGIATVSAQTQLPYLQSFDYAGTSGWTSVSVGGGTNTWEFGSPSKPTLSGVYTEPNAWVTSLTGEYADGHNAAIVSPQFNFSTLFTDPMIRFTHKFLTESCCDGGVVEISLNGGPWTVLDNSEGTGANYNTANSQNWYNGQPDADYSFVDNSNDYASSVNGWIKSQTTLTGAAGKANVRIRFRFTSDGSVTDEGWMIDNIEIFSSAPAPFVSTGSPFLLTNTDVTLGIAAHDMNNAELTLTGVLVSLTANPSVGDVGVIDSPTTYTGAGEFHIPVNGLTPSTLYYYRAYAINSSGTYYGPDSTFTTFAAPIAPILDQKRAKNVTGRGALLSGSILSSGGAAVSASGFIYSESPNPVLGGMGVVDSTTNPVVGLGSVNIVLGGLNAATTYYYRFYATNISGTTYGATDSFTTEPVISTLPYTQNFDSPVPSYWTSETTGGLNNWVLGTPAKPIITGPSSSPNAWVTKTTNDYDDNHDAAVVSVQFDFSALTFDPVLSFSHIFETESCCDGGIVEISINGGAWTVLDDQQGTDGDYNTATSLGWYNGDAIGPNCFVGNSSDYASNVNGWIRSRTTLTGAAGQADVKIRFRFSSDGSSTRDGWAIDDITVSEPVLASVTTNSAFYITSANGNLHGLITDNGGSPILASGVVFGTSANPSVGDPGVADSTTNPLVERGKYSVYVNGLTPSTVYHYRAYAITAIGTSYGADSTFTTNATATVPLLENDGPNNVGYASVTLGGNVLSDGGDATTATGVVFSTTTNPVVGGMGVVDSPNTGMTLPFEFDITGLTPATKYYFRAYAVNGAGTGYGQLDSFTTDPAIVRTYSYSNLTTNFVKLDANIRNINGTGNNGTITQSGIVLSTAPAPEVGGPGVTDSITNPRVTNGNFSIDFAGLTPGTQYYYRAYAISSLGTFYGYDSTFTTRAVATLADVRTRSAEDVTQNSATIGGEIISDGGEPITASGVVYGTTPAPAIGDAGVVDSTTNPLVISGRFSFDITGLVPGTKYYVRSYAINVVGTAYGVEDSFTTEPIILVTIPYTENFDSGINGWKSERTGGENNWAFGTPTKTEISSALSAPNCWVTGLSGEYDDDHNAAVVSPQLDFSSLTIDPVIRFAHKFYTESCCDAGVLEISINGGTWTILDNVQGTGANYNTLISTAWYNATSIGVNSWASTSEDYSSEVNGWITSQTLLAGVAGQSNVRIRFRFQSDVSSTDEGWAIDNIEILNPALPAIVTGTRTVLTQSGVTLHANVISTGGAQITASGIVLGLNADPSIGDPGVTDSTTNPVVNNGPFNIRFNGLTNATTYHYRSYVTNAMGTTYGADSVFTTNLSASLPDVDQSALYGVTGTTVSVDAQIISDGGDMIISSGVLVSTTPNPVVGGMGVIDSTTNPVVTSGTYSFGFTGLAPNTLYYVRSYATSVSGTGYSSEDSFYTEPIIAALPYAQNFDLGGNIGWHSEDQGGENNWALGTPSKPNLNAPLSAPNSWVTNLTADYVDDHDASVVSPQFDFSSVIADPVLKFSHKFRTESCCDGGILEMSINGGPWEVVDDQRGTGANFNTTVSTGWYNSDAVADNCFAALSSAYASQNNGWIRSQTVLTGAGGQANVRFRFRFMSDGSSTEAGWAIDDIEVVTQSAPVIITGINSNVTMADARVYGNILDNGGSQVTASGVVYGTNPAPAIGDIGVVNAATSPVVRNGQFTLLLSGLTNGTTYHYRSYAINANGTSYGADSVFTTPAGVIVPYVNSEPAYNIEATTATFGGSITSNGGAVVTASGVVYSTSPAPVSGNPGVTTVASSPLTTLGTYMIDVAGLTPSTVYYFRAFATNSAGTSYGATDSFTTSPLISLLPYTQNFDVPGVNGWASQATGGNNNWMTGTPAKPYISAALSAPNVWITNLTGDYDDDHDAALVSPRFDLSGYTADPVLRFSHKFETESCCDAGVLEMSINGGAWNVVNNTMGGGANYNTTSSIGWYNTNDPGFNGWGVISDDYASEVNGWIRSETRLTGAAGQSDVRFRFRFISDGSSTRDGWAIDDIEVLNLTAPSAQASAVSTGNITNNEITVSWANGNGEGRIVVAKFDTSATVVPADWTRYNADAMFGAGSNLGSFNYVVYKGTGSSVTVTGLPPLRAFTFTVYEYNGHEMLVKYTVPGAAASGTTLPVTYLSFNGKKSGADATLDWTTASEKNNKGFEVERSLDGKSFEYAGFVKGKVNSNVKQQYAFTDAGIFKAAKATVFYRLKQVDMDGQYHYSKTVAISVSQEAKEVAVYPNPFSNAFTVEVETPVATLAKLELYDMQGRLVSVMERNIQAGTTAIGFDAFEASMSGVYILRVSYADTIKTIRLVKTAQ